jgi:hypothetical protein
MTRKRLLAAAASLAALALRPRLGAQAQEPEKAGQGEDRLDGIDKRLAAIERALVDRSMADATPASRALDTRLTRLEMRIDRLERDIWNLRNRVGR